jgi:hypothetical protein
MTEIEMNIKSESDLESGSKGSYQPTNRPPQGFNIYIYILHSF